MRVVPWTRGIVLALSFGWGALSYAQDLADVWALALARDPFFAASRYSRDADQEKVPQARAQLLPYISASAGAQVDDTRRLGTLGNSHRDRRAVWALTLTQPLFDVRAWNALEHAQYTAQAADVIQAQAYQDLILRVAQAYFDILSDQDTLRALRAQKLAVETQLQAAQHGFELGATTITDTHEAQARLDLLRASELEAVNALQVSNDRLAAIIAAVPTELAELPADARLPAPEPDRLDSWVNQASDANLAVARAELDTRLVEKQLDMAKSEHYPRVHLQAQTGSATDRGLQGGPPNPGQRSLDSSIGVVLSVPLFTGGELSSVIREESSRLQQKRYELEAARRTARQAVEQYFSGVTAGLARIQALEAAETSSSAALQANQLAYEVGVRINIDVLNAQQQLYETQRLLSRARYDTLMNGLRLKASTGILNEADLYAVNELLRPPTTHTQQTFPQP